MQGGVFTLVDEDGRAVWNVHDVALIPYAQLVRSAEAGAFVGDPGRLYFVLREPIGDGLGIDWPTLLTAWDAVRTVAEGVVVVGAAAGTLKAVVGRLRRGRQALAPNVHRWAQRGALPSQFARFLDRATWSSDDLARLLGSSREDAEAILALFGFVYDERERIWRRGGDRVGELMRAVYRDAEWHGHDLLLSPAARARFEERIEEMLRSGAPLPEPRYDADEGEEPLGDAFQLVSFSVTAEGIAGVAAVGMRHVEIHVPFEELDVDAAQLVDAALIPLASRVLASEIARLAEDVEPALDDVEDDGEEQAP